MPFLIPYLSQCPLLKFVKVGNPNGDVVGEPESEKKKWKEYIERLMNVENTWDGIVKVDVIAGPIECITEMEVKNALSAMKRGKAPNATGASCEMSLAAERKVK